MSMKERIAHYKEELELIGSMGDETAVYTHVIDLGKKLKDNELSENKRTEQNRVSYCQFKLHVDKENNQYKAYSDGMISAGYAAILVDCFNNATPEEIAEVTTETFTEMGLRSLLSMNRANGFNQMVEMMKACK